MSDAPARNRTTLAVVTTIKMYCRDTVKKYTRICFVACAVLVWGICTIIVNVEEVGDMEEFG